MTIDNEELSSSIIETVDENGKRILSISQAKEINKKAATIIKKIKA